MSVLSCSYYGREAELNMTWKDMRKLDRIVTTDKNNA